MIGLRAEKPIPYRKEIYAFGIPACFFGRQVYRAYWHFKSKPHEKDHPSYSPVPLSAFRLGPDYKR
jgi:hypothetical protein